MSIRNISWGVKAAGWQSYHVNVPIVWKSGSLNLLKPQGPNPTLNSGTIYRSTSLLIFFFFLAGRAHLVNWSDCGLAEREIFFDSLLQGPGLALGSTQPPMGTGHWVTAIKDLGACSWPLTLIHYRAYEWSHMATPLHAFLAYIGTILFYCWRSTFYWNNLSRVHVI